MGASQGLRNVSWDPMGVQDRFREPEIVRGFHEVSRALPEFSGCSDTNPFEAPLQSLGTPQKGRYITNLKPTP